jgi:hypothetical protein
MTGMSAQIKRQGVTFYVQTQDGGLQVNYIESLIYKSGTLLTSRKTFYTSYLGLPNFQEKAAQIMQDQHEAILKDISDGKFDRFLTPGEK